LHLGGLIRTSFSDFPGRVAVVAFNRGCNFRCPYCHNPELIHARGDDPVGEDELFDLLHKRRGQLDGVVFSGGEPTLQADLVEVIGGVRALGFEVKLDTNGSRPDVLEVLLGQGLVDLVAMDVKAPLPRYSEVAGVLVDTADITRSIQLLLAADVEVEFRTTVAEPLIGLPDVLAIGELVRGASRYVLQPFVAGQTLDTGFVGQAPDLERMCATLVERGIACTLR